MITVRPSVERKRRDFCSAGVLFLEAPFEHFPCQVWKKLNFNLARKSKKWFYTILDQSQSNEIWLSLVEELTETKCMTSLPLQLNSWKGRRHSNRINCKWKFLQFVSRWEFAMRCRNDESSVESHGGLQCGNNWLLARSLLSSHWVSICWWLSAIYNNHAGCLS